MVAFLRTARPLARSHHCHLRHVWCTCCSIHYPVWTSNHAQPQVCMMIYVFGDLRQLRSFELARFPEAEPVKEKQKDAKHKFDIKVFANSHHAPDSHFVPQPIVGPSPALLPSPTPADAGVPALQSPAEPSQSRATRPIPPKLHIVPPQPAHTRAPLHASSVAYPTLARTRSISSESLQYPTRLGKRGRDPCFAPASDQEYDTDDLCSESGSEYESEYGSSSESGCSSSYSVADEGRSVQKAPKSANKRQYGRRRRRKEPEIHISDAFLIPPLVRLPLLALSYASIAFIRAIC